MNTCETPGCGNTCEPDKHLCKHCIRDLKGRLEQGIKLIPELNITIARLDAVRPGNVEGGNGTKSAGSAAPVDMNALLVQMTLEEDTRYTAEQYAADPWAAEDSTRVIENIATAERMISGPEDDHIDHAGNRAKVEEIAPPMPTRQLLPWLRANAKIPITSMDIRIWAHRGHLRPVEREPSPTYWPHEVIAAYHQHKRAASLLKAQASD